MYVCVCAALVNTVVFGLPSPHAQVYNVVDAHEALKPAILVLVNVTALPVQAGTGAAEKCACGEV